LQLSRNPMSRNGQICAMDCASSNRRTESPSTAERGRLTTCSGLGLQPRFALMIKHTFIHAEGVGPSMEKKLWSAGIRTWEDFLERQRENNLPGKNLGRLTPLVEDSLEAVRRRDVGFFGGRLKPGDQWRIYREFSAQAAFVDIETTGLSADFDQITVVGLLAGGTFRAFVQGRDLEQFPAFVSDFPLVITFNGARFDLPFLRRKFPGFRPHAHIDLRYPLSKLGHKGGLKQIERKLGIVRPTHLREVDGYEAVRLWSEHRRGKAGALERLLEYCQHDVVNMKPLAERVAAEMPGLVGLTSAAASP
jgi:uncharacterized protein